MNGFESKLKTAGNNEFRELFVRHGGNPILTARDWPYPVNTVFNPGAIEFQGQTLLLARVEDRRGFSHLTKAISADGITNWKIDATPTMLPAPGCQSEHWGIEDPRLTWLEELGRYAVVYTGYSRSGPAVNLALTEDFVSFDRYASVMPPEDKDAALFPRRINGNWLMIHRPIEHGAHIWISSSENLKYWGDHKILIRTRDGCWWDGAKVGLSAPPLETAEGWLLLYHGVKATASGNLYRLGLALLDLEDPTVVTHRSEEWIFGPQEPYEKYGDVADVVFPCGWIHDKTTDVVRMYYGGADTCIALATAKMSDLLTFIKSCEQPYNLNVERRS